VAWGRLDDQLHQNGKVLSFSDRAFRVWVYSISFCNAKHARDATGSLSEDEARALCRLAAAPRTVIAELLDKRGWDRAPASRGAPAGYAVHDYPKYGPFFDRTNAQRQKRFRDARRDGADVTRDQAVSHGSDNGVVTRYVTDPIPIPNPIPHAAASHTEHGAQQETPVANQHMAISRSPRAGSRPRRTEKKGYDPAFEAWWSTYPRHDGKLPAAAAYARRIGAGRTPAELDAAAGHFAAHHEAAGTPTAKIPHGATWLNQHRDEEWRTGPPDADRPAAPHGAPQPRSTGPPSKLAQTAANLRHLKALREANGDERTSFFDLATAGVGVPDPGRRGTNPGALPGPFPGPPLA
jgi:hypothetical protein